MHTNCIIKHIRFTANFYIVFSLRIKYSVTLTHKQVFQLLLQYGIKRQREQLVPENVKFLNSVQGEI